MGNFYDFLNAAWTAQNSAVCVGLDPDLQRIPTAIRAQPKPIYAFCKAIVDATAPYVCAFKPQFAHFAGQGALDELQALCEYIKSEYPGVVLLLDAKRGDVGSTADFYAREAYEQYQADAVTLSPYLGHESVAPFLAYGDKGVVILCRTSNPDSNWLQMHGSPSVFETVAATVATWNDSGQCMLVAGATYPEELATIRGLVGDMPLLVPGVGAQGGDLQAVLEAGLDSQGRGLVISSSRGVLYASAGDDFPEAAAAAAQTLRDAIRTYSSSS